MTSMMPPEGSENRPDLCFVEWIGLRSLLRDVLPFFISCRLKGSKFSGGQGYVVDGHPFFFWLLERISPLFGWDIDWLRFDAAEVADEDGILLVDRLLYFDLVAYRDALIRDPEFLNSLPAGLTRGARMYILKRAMRFDLLALEKHEQVYLALLLIQTARWYIRRKIPQHGRITVFLCKRPWFHLLVDYGRARGVSVRPSARFNLLGRKFTKQLGATLRWWVSTGRLFLNAGLRDKG